MDIYHELSVGLTDDDRALKEHIHRFAKEVLRPSAMALDEMTPEQAIAKGSVYWDVWRQIKELGLHKRGMPEHLGGVMLTPIQNCILMEELSWGSIDWAVAFGASSMPYIFANVIGSPRLVEEVVIPYIEDKDGTCIGCWAITEPARGYDVMLTFVDGSGISFDTRAKLDGDNWIISGQKSAWVSNGTVAKHALTFVSAETEDGKEPAVGVCVVALDQPGVSKGKPLNKIGQRALNQGEIFFDEVAVPRSEMVILPRRKPEDAPTGSTGFNPNAALGVAFVGVARAAFEETLEYCKNRVQGGAPLVEHQLVQRKLFDMMTKVETARAYARAVSLYNSANPLGFGFYSNASKIYATQVAYEIADQGVQLHGGIGLCKGMLIEKLFRDARAGLIEDGANDSLALSAAPSMVRSYVYSR
ncbi:MAG: acyl-CoA dehydrogenase family protein [Dehalococcoidia bacterium]|nr:acyl-CoA dehydrogenase family protein [Dehalococcoidia bacterium]